MSKAEPILKHKDHFGHLQPKQSNVFFYYQSADASNPGRLQTI